jgi:hypothetical protein
MYLNNFYKIAKCSRGDLVKPVPLHAKVQIYKSDGFGRDSYIT